MPGASKGRCAARRAARTPRPSLEWADALRAPHRAREASSTPPGCPRSSRRYSAQSSSRSRARSSSTPSTSSRRSRPDFLAACAADGVESRLLACVACAQTKSRLVTPVRRIAVETPRDEIEHAARWARARLEAAKGTRAPRIGIVVPDLAQRRREVARVFARTFEPAGVAPGASRAPLFNLSLGEPLDRVPARRCRAHPPRARRGTRSPTIARAA